MLWFLKLAGFGVLLVGAIYTSGEYAKYIDKNTGEGEDAVAEAEKKKKIARALLIGGALAVGVMLM